MTAVPDFETITFSLEDHVATVTLNRPDKLNSFNQTMLDEFTALWQHVRTNDEVHVVVLRAAGDRAFCTGVDVGEGISQSGNIWHEVDPGMSLSPRNNKVYKPVIVAVHGMCAGGAFYWINDSDIIIAADTTTFFDPHVSYGMVSALEPIGLAKRVPLGEALRWALIGLDERMSAERAREIGLVSEVVAADELWSRADELARIIARKPSVAVQGTVKAIWDTLDMPRVEAQETGWHLAMRGNPIGTAEVSREGFTKPQWTLR